MSKGTLINFPKKPIYMTTETHVYTKRPLYDAARFSGHQNMAKETDETASKLFAEYVYVYMNMYMYTYKYKYIYIYVCTHIYIYIRIAVCGNISKETYAICVKYLKRDV